MDQTRTNEIIHNSIYDVPGNTYQDKLNHLNLCTCCKRHNINKPFVFTFCDEKKTVYTPETLSTFTINDINCSCKCRHTARFICRQYETPDVDISITPPQSP